MKKLFTIVTIALLFCSCSKNNTSNNNTATIDYTGKYQGPTTAKVTAGGSTTSSPYTMVLDISNGANANEIKILFGSWLTIGTLTGNTFVIQQTTFPGPLVTTGNGSFSGNTMTISYTNTTSSSVVNYSGTLTKF